LTKCHNRSVKRIKGVGLTAIKSRMEQKGFKMLSERMSGVRRTNGGRERIPDHQSCIMKWNRD